MALTTKEAVHIGVPKFDGEGEPDKLAFSPDGTHIAAGETRWTTVWTLDGRRVWTAAPGGHPVWLDRSTVLVTGFTNQPCVFAAETGRLTGTMNATAHDAVALGNGVAVFHGKFAGGESGLTIVSADGEVVAEEGEMLPFDNEGRMRMGFGDMEIVALQASANGLRIAVSRRKQKTSTLRVVDASLKTIFSRDLSTQAFALDTTGARIAIAGGAGVTLLDGDTGAETSTIAVDGSVMSLAFAPDGTLAIGLAAGGVRFADAAGTVTGTFVPDGLAPDERIAALAFSPDGKHLAAGLSQRLTVRDMTTGRELGGPPAHVRGTHHAAILAGAASIVTRGPTSTKVWTLGSGELKATHAHESEIWPVPPLAGGPGGIVFDAGADGVIRLRDALRWEVAGSLTPNGSPVPRALAIAVAPAAKRLLALLMPEDPKAETRPEVTAAVFDLESGKELRVFGREPFPAPPPPPPDPELDAFRRPREGAPSPHKLESESRIAISPDGTRVALTTRNEEFEEGAHVIEVATGIHRGHIPAESGVKSLAFLDDETVLLEPNGGELRIAKIAESAGSTTPAGYASLPALSPSRTLLASWDSESGAVGLREVSALDADPAIVAERVGVTKLLFSDDERFLAAILQDGSVRVWSISR